MFAVVDGHCSSPKHINSDVLQGYVLSLILFSLFSNDLLSLTQCPILSYSVDTNLHFLNRRLTQQDLSDPRWDAIGRLSCDFSLVFNWGKANLDLFNASKMLFLQLFLQHNLPDNYPLFFNDTQLPLSSTLPAACSVQRPYPPMYGIWFSCFQEFNSHSFTKQGGV